jgi:plasmid maintenance system antidote protein VapI
MENDPSVNEEVNEVSDKLKLAVLKKKIKQYKDKVFKKTMSTIKSPLFAGDEIEEGRMKDIFTADQEGKSAEEIAKLMKLPLKTVKSILGEEVYQDIAEFTSDMIKRLQKSYSTMPKTISPEQAKALSKHLDRLDLASLKQLTKAKIPFVTTLARNKVYKKTGKFEEIQEADINVDNVKKDDSEKEKELKIKLDKEKDQDALEKQLIAAQGQINILKQKLENEKNKAIKPEPNPKTGEVPLTVGVAYKHFKNEKEKEKEKEEVKEAMSDRDKRIQRAKDMIKYYDAQKKAALKGKNKDLAKKMLKNDIEEADLSKKQIKMVHKVADDLPKKDFKDRYGKEKGDAVRFGTATNMVKKKLGMNEDRRLYVETIAGLKKKAEKSGMPYSILKKVYDRGMAAWKSGHRPGASQQQWAFARVNSFVTKSSGTWGGADKDLAKQVRGK